MAIKLAAEASCDPRTAARWLKDPTSVVRSLGVSLQAAHERVRAGELASAPVSEPTPEGRRLVVPGFTLELPAKPAKKARARTAVDTDSNWNGPQETTLRACGRDPRAENAAFIAHHEAKGTLSASWKASRTTWVLNVQKGYGAPARQTPPGLVAHAAQKGMSPDSPAIERPEHRAYRPKPIEVAPVGTAGEASAKLMASLRSRQ